MSYPKRVRQRHAARLEDRNIPNEERRLKHQREARRILTSPDAKIERRQLIMHPLALISILILFGNPKSNEPLCLAWRRCLESPIGQVLRDACAERMFDKRMADDPRGKSDDEGEARNVSERTNNSFLDEADDYVVDEAYEEISNKINMIFGPSSDRPDPFNYTDDLEQISLYFWAWILPQQPGSTDAEKLSRIFAQAPGWFLWFAGIDQYAHYFGADVRDLSPWAMFDRSKSIWDEAFSPIKWRRSAEPDRWWMPGKIAALTARERKRLLKIQSDRERRDAEFKEHIRRVSSDAEPQSPVAGRESHEAGSGSPETQPKSSAAEPEPPEAGSQCTGAAPERTKQP